MSCISQFFSTATSQTNACAKQTNQWLGHENHNIGSHLIIPLRHRSPQTKSSWQLCQMTSIVRHTTQNMHSWI